MAPSIAPLMLNNFSLTTWLLFGATIQSLLFLILPQRVALSPAFFVLLLRGIKLLLITNGRLTNPGMEGVHPKTMTVLMQDLDATKIPEKGPVGQKVVCFIVGASANQ